ncbi:MAG: hypothetical protein KGI08_09830, partial [Thaumarchaeota archaeon]|nr:hypothetical protein [Nitrososphaerota archaeon]
RTQLNAGNNLNTPDSVKAILGITPFIEPQTLTAGQSVAALIEMDSPTVTWKPKQIFVGPIASGLGATFVAAHPILRELPCFTKINTTGVKQLQSYGTALIANTSAPLAGVEINYSLDAIDPRLTERFYQTAPIANLPTSTGTAAATVNGPSIQISTGKNIQDPTYGLYGGFLEEIQAIFMPGTVAASNSLVGYMSFFSNDIMSPEPITIRCHPLVSGLGATGSLLALQTNIRTNIHRPIKSTALINQSATFDITPTNAGNFVGGIGYSQPP